METEIGTLVQASRRQTTTPCSNILKRRIEEEADSYAGIVKPAFINDTFDKYAIAQAFEDGAEFALSHQWISVEEALPEYYEAVIVTTRHPDYFFCHRSDNPVVETDEDGWCNYTKEKIIAWMPIPELKAQRRR